MRSSYLSVLASLLVLVISNPTQASWTYQGALVSAAAGDQAAPAITSDGAGGAIVVWQSYSGGDNNIYAQRIDASGNAVWTTYGVALCTVFGDQAFAGVVSDGAGGAIATWQDRRFGWYDIYAQRINANGTTLWTADGVLLSAGSGSDHLSPKIVSDGTGGAIVAWSGFTGTMTGYDIYVRRVNSSGSPQWTAGGVGLCLANSYQYNLQIVSDGAGGAIVAWEDIRSGPPDIYARRVNASGTPQWTVDGVALCTASWEQILPSIVSDGAGGAIVAWSDYRLQSDADIYAGRINASGTALWTNNGVLLCGLPNDQLNPTLAADGAGGAIVSWQDARSVTQYDIYAHRIDALGNLLWPADGIGVCILSTHEFEPRVLSDGAGGAIIAWHDQRNDSGDIFASRLDPSGIQMWGNNGMPLCTVAGQQMSQVLASNGAGGAIVAWQDGRTSATWDVYAQRAEGRYGYWGNPEPALASVSDVPGDQGGKVKVNWYASGRDALNQQVISHYSIWRATDPSAVTEANMVGLSEIGRGFAGPAVRVERTPTADFFWELVATQDAVYLPSYTYSATTTYDSTATGTATHRFQVIAHAYYNQFINWPSNVMSGHSVDNLAPAAPLLLTAQRVGADVNLQWNRAVAPDLRDYSIYRATSTGVTPVPINFLSSSEDTVAVDASAPTSALYYIVTALDVHANQSPPSNEASVGSLTGIGNTPLISALTVLDNMPNPFAGTTTLRVGLPKASEVEVEVFDVAGRSVRSERTSTLAAGWREIAFDARDGAGVALPSGVYFYRVKAAGETLTRKMVIAR